MTDYSWTTADLADAHPDTIHAALSGFHDFGGVRKFHGEIATLLVDEDWRPVLVTLEEPGQGRVLVVDGGGSLDRAILGERLLHTAATNGWVGVVVNGAVRDTAVTREIPIGLRALGVVPQRGESGEPSHRQRTVTFAGVTFTPGERLWADADGIVVGTTDLG